MDVNVAMTDECMPTPKTDLGPVRRIQVMDNVMDLKSHETISEYLNQDGWKFGWKSNRKTDHFSFWHKHFAGSLKPDHYDRSRQNANSSCEEELERQSPLLFGMWRNLESAILQGHTLVRCYANGASFGSEGSIHTDSTSPQSCTTIFYPNLTWHPNWGGETVFFEDDYSDLITSVYPKPNRLVVFPGTMPHVARGVSRVCPVLRITLMFKTEKGNASQGA